MEDYWLGYATERIFLPLLQMTSPEIVDYHMPPEGIFHNLVFVSIRKDYPGQAYKVMQGMWGQGLMSLAKVIVVVDDWVDVRNVAEAWWVALNHIRVALSTAGLSRAALYARFVKLEHTGFALPFALVGAILASYRYPVSVWDVFWIVVAFTAARFAAMAFNRVVDREFDAKNPRTAGREIPTGAISVREGKLAVVVSSAVFIASAAMLNPLCLVLSPVALAAVLGYSYAKRYTSAATRGCSCPSSRSPSACGSAGSTSCILCRMWKWIAASACTPFPRVTECGGPGGSPVRSTWGPWSASSRCPSWFPSWGRATWLRCSRRRP